MPQTTYTNAPAVALAGMLADNGDKDITSAPAAEVIPAGRACALKADGTVELPKNTSALPASGTGSLKGISIYQSHMNPGGYQIGDMVPLLRKGRIWTDFVGTGATDQEALTVRHASDDTNTEVVHRGKFSDAAASTTAGQEKTAFAKGYARGGVSNTLALVEINLP